MHRCIFATVFLNIFLIFPGFSAETRAIVTPDNCHIITAHTPRDDVAYQSGVDARGKPVTPADLLPAPDNGLKDKISFQLILDVVKESRGDAQKIFADHTGLEGDIKLGQIVIENGRATLGGKPLSLGQQTMLYDFCRKSEKQP